MSQPWQDVYMFDGYGDIFNRRGASYHASMERWPHARDEEFAAILESAHIRDGDVIVDAPAGGGYLSDRIPQDVSVICVETSQAFSERVQRSQRVSSRLCELHATGLESASVDKVICLAGLHHVAEKKLFFAEMFRLLKKGGRFCIADAGAGSFTARFLDEFVHAHNSMGHQGDYLSPHTSELLRDVGFSIVEERVRNYHWNYPSVDDMCTFCAWMFGLDRATPPQILEGINRYLQWETHGDGIRMNWQLTFLTCEK